ncbi:MAG: hypothetical protein NTV01_13505, partial [Bacteroidia bacterium]|nr:hypothetical protein [Bacteroidia bacterium]
MNKSSTMKHAALILLIVILTVIASLFNSCKKPNDNANNWPDDEKEFVTEVLTFQDQAGLNFTTWTISMDSLAAVEKLRQYFLSNPNVSYAKVTDQGISVQYTNGTRGGIMLNSQRFPENASEISEPRVRADDRKPDVKSSVNNKKMILFDAAYSEVKDGQTFKYYTDQVISNHRLNLPKITYSLDKVYTDEQATLERYTQLSGYGIIDLAAHGFGWEDSTGIVDVYMLTGETANLNTKYWVDLSNNNMIIMQYKGKNKYWISERFISGHNNFSKDTVLMIGSFCHSFRGKWPNLQKSFASGAYVGYTRRVNIDKCANYDSNLIFCLSDTTKSPLMNITDWMNDPTYPKYYEYWSDPYPVHVEFAGDSTLTLLPDTTTTVKDIDGNLYHVKKIGKQYWTVENLKTTRLNDGTAIPNVTNSSSWSKLTSMAYCWYDNDPVNKTDYGALYNWFAVDTKKLAPRGWHVATLADWNQMIDPLG